MPSAVMPVVCIFCERETPCERRGAEWFCTVCRESFYAETSADKQFLRRVTGPDPDGHLGGTGD